MGEVSSITSGELLGRGTVTPSEPPTLSGLVESGTDPCCDEIAGAGVELAQIVEGGRVGGGGGGDVAALRRRRIV